MSLSLLIQSETESTSQFWSRVMEAWEKSTERQAAFCTAHELSYAQFRYWRERLQRGKKKTKSHMIPLKVSASSAAPLTTIQLRAPTGVQLSIPAGSDLTTLSHVFQLLGLGAC